MTELNDRIEGEIKTHEAEMLKKAVIAKYGSKPLPERIAYIMDRYKKDLWTSHEAFTTLAELGLTGSDSEGDVKKLFSDPAQKFPSKVQA